MGTQPIAQPAPLTTEQKILASIGLVSQTATAIASSFGHGTVAGAVSEFSSLAPVFAGLFDSIKGLFSHIKAQPSS